MARKGLTREERREAIASLAGRIAGACLHGQAHGTRGDCSWCFAGAEYCPDCREYLQYHDDYCPEGDGPADYELAGIIHLKAFGREERLRIFEPLVDERRDYVTWCGSSKTGRGWEQAIWLGSEVPQEIRTYVAELVCRGQI